MGTVQPDNYLLKYQFFMGKTGKKYKNKESGADESFVGSGFEPESECAPHIETLDKLWKSAGSSCPTF